MDFAHGLDTLLNALFPFFFGAGIIVWLVGFGSQIKRYRCSDPVKKRVYAKRVYFCMALFMGFVAIPSVGAAYVTMVGQAELLHLLQSPVTSVKIKGQDLPNAGELLNDLRAMNTSLFRAHHSHPTRIIEVLLETPEGEVALKLARDSANSKEYWVFYPAYKMTSSGDIGRALTSVLDEY